MPPRVASILLTCYLSVVCRYNVYTRYHTRRATYSTVDNPYSCTVHSRCTQHTHGRENTKLCPGNYQLFTQMSELHQSRDVSAWWAHMDQLAAYATYRSVFSNNCSLTTLHGGSNPHCMSPRRIHRLRQHGGRSRAKGLNVV